MELATADKNGYLQVQFTDTNSCQDKQCCLISYNISVLEIPLITNTLVVSNTNTFPSSLESPEITRTFIQDKTTKTEVALPVLQEQVKSETIKMFTAAMEKR